MKFFQNVSCRILFHICFCNHRKRKTFLLCSLCRKRIAIDNIFLWEFIFGIGSFKLLLVAFYIIVLASSDRV